MGRPRSDRYITVYSDYRHKLSELILKRRKEGYRLVGTVYKDNAAGRYFQRMEKRDVIAGRYTWTIADEEELIDILKKFPKMKFTEISEKFIPERTPHALRGRANMLRGEGYDIDSRKHVSNYKHVKGRTAYIKVIKGPEDIPEMIMVNGVLYRKSKAGA